MKDEELNSWWMALQELSAMVVTILRSPPIRDGASSVSSPTAFASLFLGISLALMLFGSVAFALGFVLMPLLTGLVVMFYAIQFLFCLSQFGRSILFSTYVPAFSECGYGQEDVY